MQSLLMRRYQPISAGTTLRSQTRVTSQLLSILRMVVMNKMTTTIVLMAVKMRTTTTMMEGKMKTTMRMIRRMDVINYVMFFCFLISETTPRVSALSGFKMLSQNSTTVVGNGQTAVLECSFQTSYFNLFEYPIVWKKRQFNEETQVNMMGNLMEPFLAARRFQSTFETQRPKHTFRLTIADVQPEDVGNYSCEITGPNSIMVAMVTNHVVVTAPIDMLILSSRNSSNDHHHHHHHRRRPPSPISPPSPHSPTPYSNLPYPLPILSYAENVPGSLWCIAKGGYLPPTLSVKIGSKFKEIFKVARSVSYSGKKGLRSLYYTTFYWLDNFVATANDDEGIVECLATVNDNKTQVVANKLTVSYAPLITCDTTSASLNEKNIFLKCEVRSKPPLDNVYWVIDDNGTKLQEGTVLAEYWVLTLDRTDGITESQLCVRQVAQKSFRAFIFMAENTEGVREKAVYLKQKFYLERQPPPKIDQPKTKRLQHYRGDILNTKFGFGRSSSSSSSSRHGTAMKTTALAQVVVVVVSKALTSPALLILVFSILVACCISFMQLILAVVRHVNDAVKYNFPSKFVPTIPCVSRTGIDLCVRPAATVSRSAMSNSAMLKSSLFECFPPLVSAISKFCFRAILVRNSHESLNFDD